MSFPSTLRPQPLQPKDHYLPSMKNGKYYSDSHLGTIKTAKPLISKANSLASGEEDERKLFEAAEAEARELVRKHLQPSVAVARESETDHPTETRCKTLGLSTDKDDEWRLRGQFGHKNTQRSQNLSSTTFLYSNNDFAGESPSRIGKGSKASKEAIIDSRSTSNTSKGLEPVTGNLHAKNDGANTDRTNSIRQNPFCRAKLLRSDKGLYRRGSAPISGAIVTQNSLLSQANKSQSVNISERLSSPVKTDYFTTGLDPLINNSITEIRSEEIRAATSMKRRDRSPKLPMPTYVSKSPDRPIVSFGPRPSTSTKKMGTVTHNTSKIVLLPSKNVKQEPSSLPFDYESVTETNRMEKKEYLEEGDNQHGSGLPSIHISSDNNNSADPRPPVSPIPKINLNNDTSSPHSHMSDQLETISSAPEPNQHIKRHNTNTLGSLLVTGAANNHFSRIGALCNNCALPISGRILSAAGYRFHPDCFRCHHCSEGLECVAFYPEPEARREERLLRSFQSLSCEEQNEIHNCLPLSIDNSMRFYCHLDYHEFFSPRCKSCKTPIEGEVIVACGAEWHVGHFFCAECGDVS